MFECERPDQLEISQTHQPLLPHSLLWTEQGRGKHQQRQHETKTQPTKGIGYMGALDAANHDHVSAREKKV